MQEIDTNLKPSAVLVILSSLILLCTACLVFDLPLSWWVRSVILGLVLVYGGNIFWHTMLLRGKNAILKIALTTDGWEIHDQTTIYPAELGGESTVTTLLCVLRFKVLGENRKRSVIIFRDAIEPEIYRRFVAILRMTKILPSQ